MAIAWSAGSRVGALLFQTLPLGVPSVAGPGGRAVERWHGVSGSGSVGLAVPMPEDLGGPLLEVDAVLTVGLYHALGATLHTATAAGICGRASR